MRLRFLVRYDWWPFLLLLVGACALTLSAPTLADELDDAASSLYQNVRFAATQRGALITSGADYDRIQSITKRLIAVAPEMRPDAATWGWDVLYIRSPKVNAMCLPGGQMIVLSSLVERLALTDDEIAAVMGHEMAHALLDHQRDQYTQRQTARVAVGLLGIIAAIAGAKHHTDPNLALNTTTAVGTIGAELLALRPYSRDRELAADKYGAELAARAGFDPHGAITLQRKLATDGMVEFLSTHPTSETRVEQLAQVVPFLTERFASRHDAQPAIASAGRTNAVAAAPAVVVHDPITPAAVAAQGTSALVASASVTADASATSDPDAVTGTAAAALTSKHMFNAERYARSTGCDVKSSTMTTRAPTYEVFAVACARGSELTIRCEYGSCAITR